MSVPIFQFQAFEDGGVFIMARIVGNAGTAITNATLTRLDYSVTDFYAETTPIAFVQITPFSSIIFDTLQTDVRWTKDATGYNFGHAVAAVAFPTRNRKYMVSYKFTPSSGEVFWFRPEIFTMRAY